MSGTELVFVLIVALLLLGPSKLPQLARSLGKGIREFKRATEDLRSTVETEFYRMDQPGAAKPPGAVPLPAKADAALPGAKLGASPTPDSAASSSAATAPAPSATGSAAAQPNGSAAPPLAAGESAPAASARAEVSPSGPAMPAPVAEKAKS